jgi:hypothetical protein
VLGDALHNLRSSLDHLVYQLSLLTTKNPKGTEFPIYITKASNSRDCFEQKGREKIRHVPKEAQELIEAAQPYNARHPDQPSHHYLWLLHELNRLDKHRFVLETYAMTGTAILPLKRKRMIFFSGKLAAHPRTRCEEGDELLRISADYIADIEQDEEPEISFQVVLSIPIASDRPWYVVPVLNDIYHSISNDLFPEFTRFF